MVHTVHLDDKYTDVRKLLEELSHYRRGVHFEEATDNKNFSSDITEAPASEEYITVEEFRKEAKSSLTKLLNKHGIY
jgi:hypothetical protein